MKYIKTLIIITIDNGPWDRTSWYFYIKNFLQVNSFNLFPKQIFFITKEHINVTEKLPCLQNLIVEIFQEKKFQKVFSKTWYIYALDL